MAKANTSAKTSDPGVAQGDDDWGPEPATRVNLPMETFRELKDLQGLKVPKPRRP